MSVRTIVFYAIVIVTILSSYVIAEQIKQRRLMIVDSHEISHK